METQTSLYDQSVIDGKNYTRAELWKLERDPVLRNLARWVQTYERPQLSRTWIGSGATKADLIELLLGGKGKTDAEFKGDSVAGDQKILTVPASVSGNNGKIDLASLSESDLEAELAKRREPRRHRQFGLMAQVIAARVPAALVGPAGSGKTTAAEQAAHALGLAFEPQSVGPQTTQSQLMGYMDANGHYVSTAFRRAYELGAVWLGDEFDSANPGVSTCINAATANEVCGFPDRLVRRHGNFVPLLGMNTYGLGCDRVYVGRNQLDGATLDRFAIIDWDYDEDLELAIAPLEDWTRHVQQVRKVVFELKIRHIVSPRASINGGKLLQAGMSRESVEMAILWKGLASVEVAKVKALLK